MKRAVKGEGPECEPESTGVRVARGEPKTQILRPFSLMRRMSEDIGRLFEDFFGTSRLSTERPGPFPEGWWPAIDVFQRDGKLFVEVSPQVARQARVIEVREGQGH